MPVASQPEYQPQPEAPEAKEDLSTKIMKLNDTADTTAEFSQEDIDKNKLMAILAYLSWLVLIPLFGAKESKFARFHVNQGLVLAITEIVWWVAEGAVLGRLLRGLHLGFISSLVNLVFLVFAVIGVLNAANGKAKELPLIGKFKVLK